MLREQAAGTSATAIEVVDAVDVVSSDVEIDVAMDAELDDSQIADGSLRLAAMPALAERSTLLIASHCAEQLGSRAFTDIMLRYDNDWQRFLADIAANKKLTPLRSGLIDTYRSSKDRFKRSSVSSGSTRVTN